jgi:hypothetical protein
MARKVGVKSIPVFTCQDQELSQRSPKSRARWETEGEYMRQTGGPIGSLVLVE